MPHSRPNPAHESIDAGGAANSGRLVRMEGSILLGKNSRNTGTFLLVPALRVYIMSKSTDERGRIYLPKDVRERFGEQYRIVELPSHVALFPVDEDPIEGLRAAVGDAFAEAEAGALKTEAREGISREVREETEDRSQDGEA